MNKKQNLNMNENRNVRRMIAGISGSLLTTLIVTAMFAGMISKELIPEEKIGYSAIVVVLVSVIIGVSIAISKSENRILPLVCVGLSYLVVLMTLTGIFFSADYQRVGITILIVIFGCISATILSKKGGKNYKSRKSKTKRC